jgi:hypothetical protein
MKILWMLSNSTHTCGGENVDKVPAGERIRKTYSRRPSGGCREAGTMHLLTYNKNCLIGFLP